MSHIAKLARPPANPHQNNNNTSATSDNTPAPAARSVSVAVTSSSTPETSPSNANGPSQPPSTTSSYSNRKVSVPNALAMPPPKPTLELDLDAPISGRRTSFSGPQRLLASPTAATNNSLAVTPSSTSSFGSVQSNGMSNTIRTTIPETFPIAQTSTVPTTHNETIQHHTSDEGSSSSSANHTNANVGANSENEARSKYSTLVTALARTNRELAGQIDTATVYMRQAVAVNKLETVKASLKQAELIMQSPVYIELANQLQPVGDTEAKGNGSTNSTQISEVTPGIGLLSVFEAQVKETKALLSSLNAETATVVTYYLRQGVLSRSREVLREALYKAETIDKSLLDRTLLGSAHSLLQELDQRQLAATYLTQALSSRTRESLEAALQNAGTVGLNEENSPEYKEASKQLRILSGAEVPHVDTTAQNAQATNSSSTESAPARIFKRLFSIGSSSTATIAAAAASSVHGSGGLDPMYQFGAPLSRAIGKFGVKVTVNTVPLGSADSSSPRTGLNVAETKSDSPEDADEGDVESKNSEFESEVIIPLVVRDLVEHLRSRALIEPGLFRLAGNRAHVDALITSYESYCGKLQTMFGGLSVSHGSNVLDAAALKTADGSGNSATLPTPPILDDVHDCSNALKQYFRELPTPLIPFSHYSKWLDVATKLRAEPANLRVVSTDPRVVVANDPLRQLRALISSLDEPSRHVLQYLCEFLHNIALHQEFNKMTEDNLAIVFSPNLLKPQVETQQTLMSDAGLLIQVVSATIRFVPYLFDDRVRDQDSA